MKPSGLSAFEGEETKVALIIISVSSVVIGISSHGLFMSFCVSRFPFFTPTLLKLLSLLKVEINFLITLLVCSSNPVLDLFIKENVLILKITGSKFLDFSLQS